MPAATTGAAFGAANAFANIFTDEVMHGVLGAVGKAVKSDTVKNVVQGVVKQQFPKSGGLGHKEEAEFNTVKDLLSQADQYRIARVAAALKAKKEKHLQRWWMILATQKVEGMKWDPQGPQIIPSLKRSHETDVWGIPKHSGTHGKTKGSIDVEGTPADPRLISLQNVANMVRQPHGPDITTPVILYDRYGEPLPSMEGDSQAAVEYAAEHLRITILEDYHFYSWLLKWWQEADGVRSFLERSQAAVREQILSALTFWITTEIGEEALRDILAENSSVAEKRALIQEKLSEASDVKWGKIKKRSLTEQPYSPLIAFALLIAVGTLVLSTNSPLELLGYLALLGLAIVIWFWFKARKITTTRKGTA